MWWLEPKILKKENHSQIKTNTCPQNEKPQEVVEVVQREAKSQNKKIERINKS